MAEGDRPEGQCDQELLQFWGFSAHEQYKEKTLNVTASEHRTCSRVFPCVCSRVFPCVHCSPQDGPSRLHAGPKLLVTEPSSQNHVQYVHVNDTRAYEPCVKLCEPHTHSPMCSYINCMGNTSFHVTGVALLHTATKACTDSLHVAMHGSMSFKDHRAIPLPSTLGWEDLTLEGASSLGRARGLL